MRTDLPTAKELTRALGGKWMGSRGMAPCIVHKEKTGSLSIWTGTKTGNVMFKCHGCGAKGDVLIPKLQSMGLWPDGKQRAEAYVDRALQSLRREPEKQEPPPDFMAMLKPWYLATTKEQHAELAASLGVSVLALHALGASWNAEKGAWAFPMRDGAGKVIGIRLRWPSGEKKAIWRSQNGLFYEKHFPENEKVWICEGPTDTAAVLSLGLPAVGRASCNSCVEMALDLLKRVKAKRAVIISDNDEAGRNGAIALQNELKITSLLWIPPAKDIREFVKTGATKEVLNALTDGLVWRVQK